MLGFCIGVITASLLSLFLPIVPPFFSIVFGILLLLVFVWRRPLLITFMLGAGCFLASLSWQYQQHQMARDAVLSTTDDAVLVIIDTPPKVYPDYTQLSATVLSGPASGFKLSLRWQQPPTLSVGQQWRLRLQLKPVQGYANPGGFNTETYALVESVVASGHVVAGRHILLKQQYSLRQRIVARVEQAIAPYRTAPLLRALAVGERDFPPWLWQGAQQAGLGHLLAISGLHIGLVFGWMLWLGSWSKGLLAVTRQQQLALILALAVALLYAWLASFAIPTLRASIGLAILVMCRSQLLKVSLSRFWLLLVALLLLIWPFWGLSVSFWLSVLAVAIIFLVMWRYPLTHYHWRCRLRWFLTFHLILTLAMTLLGVILFGGFSPLMLLSNLLFVPWCSLVAIPLLLLSLVLTAVGINASGLWLLADSALLPLLWWLEYSAQLPVWWSVTEVSGTAVALSAIILLISLIFARKAAVLLLPLSLLLLTGSTLQSPPWQLHLLDSGQRQSVLLQKGRQALLYDMAPALATQDIAASQLAPVLRQLGVQQLDYVLFRQLRTERSRFWALQHNYQVDQHNLTGLSQQPGAGSCAELPATYQDIRLEILSAEAGDSCIVRITIGAWRILIPGKLDQITEQALVDNNENLAADIIILANNGSGAVNSLAMLQQVRPAVALNAAAFMNGYQHPAAAVQQRLALLQVPLLNTAEYGAITVEFSDQKLRLTSWRQQRLPFWLEKPAAIAETLATTR
ncbi:MAG: DNA internalization-related competence protein ComEC/Rec2 [Rheinheimera sp.]|nr:DNA internalization-related competence protein ComEC/Rec2 [Rheinheimera sp.]